MMYLYFPDMPRTWQCRKTYTDIYVNTQQLLLNTALFYTWRHVSAAHTAIFRPAYNRILWQCRVIASPVLNLGARWRHVVGFTFHILHPCKRSGGIQNLRANLDIGEGKYLFPMFGIELRFIGGPPHSKVTVLTELFLL